MTNADVATEPVNFQAQDERRSSNELPFRSSNFDSLNAAMCGRTTKNYTWEQIHALYKLAVPAAIPNMQPSFNICPTDPVDVVVPEDGRHQLVQMRWGLVPFWWSKSLKELRLATFNARVETVETKPFFREPFKQRRCLMPLSGYYEWQETPAGKQPWYFTARDGSPVLTAAGLWDQWKNKETGERIKSCTMIIAEPNEFVAEIHDRMPVLLVPEQFEHWLSGEMGANELKPAPNDYLRCWPASKRVNSSKADKDDSTLIEPIKVVEDVLTKQHDRFLQSNLIDE